MLDFSSHNYRVIGFAIGLFIVLDISILSLNIYLSNQIDQYSTEINLAGRQRMLSQRITKILLLQSETTTNSNLDDLEQSYKIFNSTLYSFMDGGTTVDTQGQPIEQRLLQGAVQQAIMKEAAELWEPLAEAIRTAIRVPPTQVREAVLSARMVALERNENLLRLMNDLTRSLESQSNRMTNRIRSFQLMAMVVAILNFAYIVKRFYGHLHISRRQRRLLLTIINNVNVAVIVTDEDNKVQACNYHSTNMFGYTMDEMQLKSFSSFVKADGDDLLGWRKDGSSFFVDLDQGALTVDDRDLKVLTIKDINDHRLTEQSLTEIAYHDALTSLPNRSLILESLSHEIARSKRSHESLAVLFVDLDGFKKVNDELGHATGDELLTKVATTMTHCCRDSDIVGRLGGDEFVILYLDIHDAETAARLAGQVIVEISMVKSIQKKALSIGASIGISVYPDHGRSPEALLSRADEAMYEAKRNGKNQFVMYKQ